jgi:tungstate transport system ATP-binding protein
MTDQVAPMYMVTGLVQEYGSRRVLEIESLQVAAGHFMVLVGPSGAGKSTLLRLLAFLEKPTQGELYFDHQLVSDPFRLSLEIRRQVTLVFQNPFLFQRSVWENVAYGLRLRGEEDREQKIEEMLVRVGMLKFKDQSARTLSGGEIQRVALARALIVRPRVLLLDEPTANLDPYHVELIEKLVQEAQQELGLTVVWVTHNLYQARRLADQAGFILNGRLIEVAQKEKLFHNPDNPLTVAFMAGEMVY